jgi:hypothetical protein
MEMQARVLSSGFYTGLVPEGLAEGAKFDFIVTLSVRPPVDPMAITQPAPDGTIGKEILATPEDTGIQDKK